MRLIDAECIWNHSVCYDIECDKCSFADGEKCKLRQRIQNVCSVDAEPVRHGHWIEYLDFWRKCSECGDNWHSQWVINHALNYCPHCGAKMDRKVNNNERD